MSSIPKVYIYNLTTGSGVETTGNRIFSMFDEYEESNPGRVVKYTKQNPPFILLKDIVEEKPDVVIMNELHTRVMLAVQAYKTTHPDVVVILLNHCHPYLTDYPIPSDSKMFEWTDEDGSKAINGFLMDGIDWIINLNHRPESEVIHQGLANKVRERYFPIDDRFTITKPWGQRSKDFFFFGAIYPIKLSGEFIEKIANRSDIEIDIYGRWRKDPENEDMLDYDEYRKTIENSPNIHYLGRIPDEVLIETLNQYRFFVLPHDGPEPFCLCLAEAIRCGCIPLVVNQRGQLWSGWIDWALDCILEYNTVDRMIEKMYYYLSKKNDGSFVNELESRSGEISARMTNKTNYDEFKKLLFELIF